MSLDTVTTTISGWSRLIRQLKDLDAHYFPYCITIPLHRRPQIVTASSFNSSRQKRITVSQRQRVSIWGIVSHKAPFLPQEGILPPENDGSVWVEFQI
jgi:hypothetical protein